MALQHLRSGTANKRANPAAMADGQLAMNTNSTSPGLFLKDSAGNLVKVGPVHVGTTAPNASPATGGSAGNSVGEQWLDTSSGTYVFRVWDGSAWRSEAGEFVNATGDTMTGALVMDNQQQVRFRETTANGTNYIALQAPASVASDKTITLPDVTGTVVTTGDTGTVTSTMLLDGTIVNADVNAAAAIAGTKINPDFGSQNVTTTGTSTAASFIPTSSTAPSNGLYLSGTNTVALATNGTGRLFVDASGRVSIGVATFSKTFNVIAADASINLRANSGGTYTDHGIFFAVDGTNYSQIYNDGPGQLIFRTGSGLAERMRLTSDGRLGLGVSSPSQLLHIRTTTGTAGSAAARISVDGASSLQTGLEFYTTPSTSANAFRSGRIYSIFDGSAFADSRITLQSVLNGDILHDTLTVKNGAVGIGTTGPAWNLSVNGATGAANYIQVTNSDTGSAASDGSLIGLDQDENLILWSQENTAVRFGSSNLERARIDSSGRLLVGTSTARSYEGNTQIIQAEASQFNATLASYTFNGNNSFGPELVFGKSRGTSNSSNTAVANGDRLGTISFYGANGTDMSNSAGLIKCEVDGEPFTSGDTTDLPGRLVFSTTADGASSPTERMRITSNGQIGSFTAAANDALYVSSAEGAGASYRLIQGRYGATGNFGGTISFNILTNGNVQNTNNSYGALSDIKLKENIVDANSQWDDLKALQVRNYNFKEGQTHTQIGLVAQEVELVSPGLVSESPDRDEEGNDLGTVTKSVNYSVLYMKAVKALQEAMERIETLEAKVAALEGV